MAAGGWLLGWLRGPPIVLCGGVAVLASAVTLFLLYGGFAWSDKGGGAMLLFAVPAALVAALAWGGFMALWSSLPRRGVGKVQAAQSARRALDDWQQDMDLEIAALEAKLAGWHFPAKRRRLETRLREQRALQAAMVDARKRTAADQGAEMDR